MKQGWRLVTFLKMLHNLNNTAKQQAAYGQRFAYDMRQLLQLYSVACSLNEVLQAQTCTQQLMV